MRILTIIRHAKSSWDEAGLKDFDRPLNARGLRNAPAMGKRFAEKKIIPDLIVSSPAKRAINTAKLIANEVNYRSESIVENDQIYDAWLADLVNIVYRIPDEVAHLFLVGHNPGMHELAEYLSDFQISKFPTCAVVQINFDTDSWKNLENQSGKVVFYDFPKNRDG